MQESLVTSRTETGFREIRGPAGSGKSLVLASRAAQLAHEGKRVLCVSYNITLSSYLRDLAALWKPVGEPHPGGSIDWVHFHFWCRRVCSAHGRFWSYRRLWRSLLAEGDETGEVDPDGLTAVLETELPQLVTDVLEERTGGLSMVYDAILVDEGQDFTLLWWTTLRQALAPGGEMVLADDIAQDIFGRMHNWTDEAKTGSGLVGSPTVLEGSYRLPLPMVAEARRFAERFLPVQPSDLPTAVDDQRIYHRAALGAGRALPGSGDGGHGGLQACGDLVRARAGGDGGDRRLTADIATGLAIVEELEARDMHCVTTFSEDGQEDARLKRAFFMGNPRFKVTTLHSFKGWESRAIVFYAGHSADDESLALVYTGLTRLLRSDRGSYMTVVCAVDKLASYGRGWPAFEHVRPAGNS